jgi:hypothetical protein
VFGSRRAALAALLACFLLFTGQISGPVKQNVVSSGWCYYEAGDLHFQSPFAGWPGRAITLKAAQHIAADSTAAFWLLTGDHLFDEDITAQAAWRDSLLAVIDSARVPVAVVPGNHENGRDAEDVDIADGTLYNEFIGLVGQQWYRPYESATHRGRRWTCWRPRQRYTGAPLNALLFMGNNNAQDTTDVACYTVNNPDVGGVNNQDFDDIRSWGGKQRRDCRACFDGLRTNDWPILGVHRAARRIITGLDSGESARPAMEEMEIPGGILAEADSLDRTVLVNDGDQHTTRMRKEGAHRYAFSASLTGMRGGDADSITAAGADLYCFAFADTAGGSQAIVDSIGVTNNVQPKIGAWETWGPLWRITVTADSVRADLLKIDLYDATAVIFTKTVALHE